jgi:molybdopterin molybdotransferase
MPQGAGRYRGTPVVTLPGNPVSALVSFEIFVRPALRAAGGHAMVHRPRVTARLAAAVDSPLEKRQYRRGFLGTDGTVSLIGGPGSHLLSSLAAANCLVEVPEGVAHVTAGAKVSVLLVNG